MKMQPPVWCEMFLFNQVKWSTTIVYARKVHVIEQLCIQNLETAAIMEPSL